MTVIQAIVRNEQLTKRVEFLSNMSYWNRRSPNDQNGFCRIQRLINEIYDQIFSNLENAIVE